MLCQAPPCSLEPGSKASRVKSVLEFIQRAQNPFMKEDALNHNILRSLSFKVYCLTKEYWAPRAPVSQLMGYWATYCIWRVTYIGTYIITI